MRQTSLLLACVLLAGGLGSPEPSPAQTIDQPVLGVPKVTGTQATIPFPLIPATDEYRIQTTPDLRVPFADAAQGLLTGSNWTGPATGDRAFYRLKVTPMAPEAIASANLLNRIAYGPTPDDLARLGAIGPELYIVEQLTPETLEESLPVDKVTVTSEDGWRYITATGSGSSSTLYVYLTAVGQGFIDDLKLVEGPVAESGINLIRNGGFEGPLTNTDWTVSANHTNSAITTEFKRTGASSLKLVATAAGSTRESAIWQTLTPALSTAKQYTLSFWFLPAATNRASATVRLSGGGMDPGIEVTSTGSIHSQLMAGEAVIASLRSYHVQRAVQSKRQLLEVMLQFLENHFVTEYSKSKDYFDRHYSSSDPRINWLSVQAEFNELQRWRAALLRPDSTFLDLLRISVESPAMIIFLDTVDNRGDAKNIANENYARELLELFTFGVDNGYDQNDIVEISKTWTGWSVGLLATADASNPHSPRLNDLPENRNISITNLVGTWSFKYRPDRHANGAKLAFPGKTVPDRFGAPWAGRPYELSIPAVSANSTNTIREGYTVIEHLANLPFTQEFLSVKFCRLFVHDDFQLGYDFTDPNLSAEGKLVLACMNAWENNSPKGQIRPVLLEILRSPLFRSHLGSSQKVKTPLEFVVSAVRSLRADIGGGSFSATTDGNIHDILNRMGAMKLFDRAEPDGYPEAASPWISAGTLAERLRFAQSFLMAAGSRTSDAINCSADPSALIKTKLPQSSWTNAEKVAAYFLSLLFPSEGKGNLSQYQQAAVKFLNTADDGTTSNNFGGLGPTVTAYDTRVRGMVAMLLTFPRFQEQ